MSLPDALVLVTCAVAGYAVGSLPVAAWIARAAGMGAHEDGERMPGSADVLKVAGPGWGLLALTADLSKGVLPVALAAVTWSWSAGLAAGLGALAGAGWPALGRMRGARGAGVVAVLVGVAFALAPPAGLFGALLALAVLGVARLAGRG